MSTADYAGRLSPTPDEMSAEEFTHAGGQTQKDFGRRPFVCAKSVQARYGGGRNPLRRRYTMLWARWWVA